LVLLGAIAYIGVLVWQKKWAELRELAYKSMLQIEKQYKAANGEQKFDALFITVYCQLPFWFQLMFPEKIAIKYLKVRLQEWYDSAKDWTDDGLINGSSKTV
jgi:hypothetical protein